MRTEKERTSTPFNEKDNIKEENFQHDFSRILSGSVGLLSYTNSTTLTYTISYQTESSHSNRRLYLPFNFDQGNRKSLGRRGNRTTKIYKG